MTRTDKSELSKGNEVLQRLRRFPVWPCSLETTGPSSSPQEELSLTPEQKRYVEERLGKLGEGMVLETLRRFGGTVEQAVDDYLAWG